MISYHTDVAAFLDRATGADLNRTLTLPWFKDPPIEVTVAEALAQVATHSHYHRAQIAVRLREIGGQPPLTDLISWYWKGRPAAVWT